MYVQLEHQLIYLAHPRTASSATAEALQHQARFEPAGTHHTTLEEGWGRVPRHELDEGWTIFCVVRNHFDALVSWHCGGQEGPGELTRPALERLLEELGRSYMPRDGELWGLHRHDANLVLRYEERLEMRLRRLLALRGPGPGFELPRKNVSESRRGRHYRDFFTAEARELAESYFAEELEELGYSF